MPYNLIFIDESESMQRAVGTIFIDDPEFNLSLVNEPSFLYKTAKNFPPDVIVLSYNTIDTELKKSITEIKTSKEFSNTPLVLLVPSDLSDNERETLIKLKTDGFIYRPFDKDAFISKIKRTLSGNYTPVRTVENAENSEEKIYDISSFETKKIPPSDTAPVADRGLTGLSAGEHTVSGTAPEPSAGESAGGKKEPGAIIDLGSSELSQAFENLFKDDAIFKEFQDLNKKEEPGAPVEPAAPDNPAGIFEANNLEEPAGHSVSFDFSEKQQFEHNFDFKREETGGGNTFNIQAEKTEGHSEGIESPAVIEPAALSEPAMPEEIFNPEEPAAPKTLGEILELNKSTSSAESGASTFNEPFAGFNTALDNNPEELNELKTSTNINTKKSEGELNLKILDEQNLVKLDDYLKNAIEKTFEEIKPQIMEIIKNGLPEIIEKLVKEEIEKIKQQ